MVFDSALISCDLDCAFRCKETNGTNNNAHDQFYAVANSSIIVAVFYDIFLFACCKCRRFYFHLLFINLRLFVLRLFSVFSATLTRLLRSYCHFSHPLRNVQIKIHNLWVIFTHKSHSKHAHDSRFVHIFYWFAIWSITLFVFFLAFLSFDPRIVHLAAGFLTRIRLAL